MTARTTLGPDELREVAFECACRSMRRAARAMTRAYDGALRPAGLRTTQFSVLVAVELHGSPTMTELADALALDRTTLTRDLGPLRRRGLVEVQPGGDRRARLVVLTDAGRTAMAEAFPLWRRAQARLAHGPAGSWSELAADLAERAGSSV